MNNSPAHTATEMQTLDTPPTATSSTATSSTGMSSGGVGKEQEIYTQRFSEHEDETRDLTWEVLVPEFFQNYVSPEDTVVDIGAGDGLFICKIKAKHRIAVDLSEHVNLLSRRGIEVHQVPADEFTRHIRVKADVIFMSNFLEHLPDKRTLLKVFEECHRALKPGGSMLILQPNIRYVGVKYWDYIDHHIALTEHSLAEALNVTGFTVCEMIPQFLPYTAKSGTGRLLARFGCAKAAVRLYLRFPILWKLFGAQTFVVATPTR